MLIASGILPITKIMAFIIDPLISFRGDYIIYPIVMYFSGAELNKSLSGFLLCDQLVI